MDKIIECIIDAKLNGDAHRNLSKLVEHLRAHEASGRTSITMHDDSFDGGWMVAGVSYVLINGTDEFPGPWTMWMDYDKIGEKSSIIVDESTKKFAGAHVATCGNCGGTCTPGVSATVFGKEFKNTCQTNLMFNNPNEEAIGHIKRLIDVKLDEIRAV
ncbi:MAG: hypothetical protein FWC95_08160 [Defluviitaleaceae bacterium]|nr:hypothetical protein [Defluviitaleaceae bacterium]